MREKVKLNFVFVDFRRVNVRYFNIAFTFDGVTPHGTHKTFIFPYFCEFYSEEKYF